MTSKKSKATLAKPADTAAQLQKVLTALSEQQAALLSQSESLSGNDFLRGMNRGMLLGLQTASAYLNIFFLGQLPASSAKLADSPKAVLPLSERQDPDQDWANVQGSAHEGFNYRFETKADKAA